MIKDRITEYFAAHREEMLERLAALCRIPSVAGEAEEGKPFGAEVDRALRLAEEMFREEGFPTERAPGGEYVLASFGEGERTVGIFAHADVVPRGEGWTVTEPFEPCEYQGLLVARGVEDNKAGIIAALYLLKAVRELGLPVDARLLVFIGGNEESGMRDVVAFKEGHALPDVSFVPDNNPPLSIGEKGRAEGWLVSPSVLRTVLDFHGGIAYNVVLGRAVATLVDREEIYASLTALTAGKVGLALTREAGVISLTAEGRSSHASSPAGSTNAAALLAGVLASCEELPEEERGVMRATARFLSDPFGGTLGIAGEDGPFGRRTAACGMARVSDGRLLLSMDIRYGSCIGWEELSGLLASTLAKEGWEFRCGEATDGFDHGDTAPLVGALLAAFRRVTGDEQAAPYRSGGLTYARHLSHAFSMGLVVNSVRPLQDDVLSGGHGHPHAPDEGLPIDSFLAAMRVLAEYVTTASGFLANG